MDFAVRDMRVIPSGSSQNVSRTIDIDLQNLAIFSTLGVFLSSTSGLLFNYQQYTTAGILYVLGLFFHGLQQLIFAVTNQGRHVVRLYERIKLHLSNSVVISMVLISQLSSPLPGMILALILLVMVIRQYLNYYFYKNRTYNVTANYQSKVVNY